MTQSNNQHRKLHVGMHDGVCAVTSSDGGSTWQQGRTTPLANAAARLSASPALTQRAYLAAYEAGVYRTDDGGSTWQHLPAYPTPYAHSVLAHANDAQTVYAGSEPAAVFRSSDGGESWQECSGFGKVPEASQWYFHGDRASHVRELRTSTQSPGTIYAGIEVGGVVRSRDGGATWEQLHGIHDDIHLVDLNPALPQRMYVATAEAPFRSDDGGDHWELINDGLERPYTLHITSAPDDAELVLVSVSSSAGRNNPQFYRSVNGGRAWGLIKEIGSNGDMVVAIDWDPGNHSRVYAGTNAGRLFCSNDRGATWDPLQVSLPSVAVGALIVAPTN